MREVPLSTWCTPLAAGRASTAATATRRSRQLCTSLVVGDIGAVPDEPRVAWDAAGDADGWRVRGERDGCVVDRPADFERDELAEPLSTYRSALALTTHKMPLQGNLAHKKTPTPLGPSLDPGHRPTVGS